MNYDEMPAGVEMDRLVAEKVTGWDVAYMRQIYGHEENWHPSTNIAHAWEVVERLPAERDGLRFCLKRDHGGAWTAGYHGLELGFAADCGEADTAPLAICRAALKALAP